MKISAKTNYACKAILELALHWPNPEPVQIKTIAQRQKIPIKFLTHILIRLKELDIVESVRGQKGGYVLSKSPQEIRLSDIAKSFMNFGDQSRRMRGKSADVIGEIWQEVETLTLKAMGKITFEEIAGRERNLIKNYLYAI